MFWHSFDSIVWQTPDTWYPPPPSYRDICLRDLTGAIGCAKLVFDTAKNFPDIKDSKNPPVKILLVTVVGYQDRVKDFFKKAPSHSLRIGDLVTCSCHGGVAIIIELFDKKNPDAPSMNMVQIYWIRYPHDGVKERVWMHTIDRLRKYEKLVIIKKED